MTRIAALSRTDIHTTHDLSVREGTGRETEPGDSPVRLDKGVRTISWR